MTAAPTSTVVDVSHARAVGRAFGDELGIGTAVEPFDAHRWQQSAHRKPTLHLDDVSAIPFLVDVAGVEEYQHRGRLRTGDGDVFVTVTPATRGYETYCRDRLGMGTPEHLVADPAGPAIAVARACASGQTYRRLRALAKEAGGMVIHPYMGIETVWELGAKLATDCGVTVRVLAPPPPVTWVANDKAAFDELVARVIDRDALVETHIASTPREIAAHLRTLAGRYPRVGLKRTRCASAMGNAVFGATEVRDDDTALAVVTGFLARTQWPRGENVLAVAWLDTDLSPSTQLWIPPLGMGDPRLDGIYEQILEGAEKVFVGSRPSTLPDRVHHALGRSALQVGAALQELGYVGRCSFDHLVEGDPTGDFRIVFTECNGRWGGTSMPMSLVDRLIGGPRPPYRAQDVVFPALIGASFAEMLELVGDDAFDRASGRGRFIFYNVGPLAGHGKFDVISIGRDAVDAERGMFEVLPARLRV